MMLKRPDRRRGFSLTEMVLATGIIAVVLVGAQSAVMIASRAVPASDDASVIAAQTGECLAAIGEDLAVATSVCTMLPHAVEFMVPDRTGDGMEDSIRFEWSGNPGDGLFRTISGGDPVLVVPSVQSLNFTYDTAEVAPPTTYAESEEAMLAQFSTATSTAARPVGKYSGDTYLRAQWFKPTLPADAAAWSITRARFTCRIGNNVDSVIRVQVRGQRSGEPTSRVLSESTVLESAMAAAWRTMDVDDLHVTGLRPDEAACLALVQATGNDYVEVLVQRSNTADSYHLSSINGGSSWTKPAESMIFTVWGRVVRPVAKPPETTLTAVRFAVVVGSEQAPTAAGRWTLLNAPVVTEIEDDGEPVVEVGELSEVVK